MRVNRVSQRGRRHQENNCIDCTELYEEYIFWNKILRQSKCEGEIDFCSTESRHLDRIETYIMDTCDWGKQEMVASSEVYLNMKREKSFPTHVVNCTGEFALYESIIVNVDLHSISIDDHMACSEWNLSATNR